MNGKRERTTVATATAKGSNNGGNKTGSEAVSGGGGGGGGVAQKMDYGAYVSKFSTQKGERFSHTRIPDRALSIGGAFMIPKAELSAFYERYYQHVFVDKKQEYLTEKQQQDTNGPCLIDFDFKYASDVEERQHEKSHVVDMVSAYMDVLNKVYDFPSDDAEIPFYVFEKATVNRLTDITKAVIHMIIGVKMELAVPLLLR